MKEHERTHSGSKPFRCEVCQKEFSQTSALNLHKKIHTGERNHGCNQCYKYFRTSAHLKRHLKTHKLQASQVNLDNIVPSNIPVLNISPHQNQGNIISMHAEGDNVHYVSQKSEENIVAVTLPEQTGITNTNVIDTAVETAVDSSGNNVPIFIYHY